MTNDYLLLIVQVVGLNTVYPKFDVRRAVHHNIISIVKPTKCTNVSNLFYFGMTLYMFRAVPPSIIRSSRLLSAC